MNLCQRRNQRIVREGAQFNYNDLYFKLETLRLNQIICNSIFADPIFHEISKCHASDIFKHPVKCSSVRRSDAGLKDEKRSFQIRQSIQHFKNSKFNFVSTNDSQVKNQNIFDIKERTCIVKYTPVNKRHKCALNKLC